ncbi:exosortase F system-associated protein [Lutibacter sp. Hel_I_33_5]|uniref:exosortase F system-associated membrane protein n=1 Tax=Lutibacter sp. Hel_I_33_5 TaxID=1566289 RepID=UPI0011A757E1|nr:exosortase F system-associated protein [Lutibacter sp. Hel_I_33_5]
MHKTTRIILIILLFLMLIFVRSISSDVFYDPLIRYFHNDYLYKMMPEMNEWKLVVNILYRYTINTLISLGIIWLIFQKKDHLKFAGFFHMTAFMILIVVFVFLLRDKFQEGYLLPFYIRRFLIHPLFLLILLPAFYYQKLRSK